MIFEGRNSPRQVRYQAALLPDFLFAAYIWAYYRASDMFIAQFKKRVK